MNSSDLQIGEIATHSGVSVDTVRYYERLKLLPRAARSGGGFRMFSTETVERIHFIKQAQEMGFSLNEIKQLFSTGGENQCRAVRELLLKKLSDLESKINQMRNFKKVLNRHLDECDNELKAHGDESACPVMVTIEKIK
ncbi:MAG: heavy metal-responsive transcriptional regulator [Acidobacteriota bacterium]|nr:heavy metal-responsive transcriptional regulator [Acidobacteriota bacterium]